jgi:hypothetical protein
MQPNHAAPTVDLCPEGPSSAVDEATIVLAIEHLLDYYEAQWRRAATAQRQEAA